MGPDGQHKDPGSARAHLLEERLTTVHRDGVQQVRHGGHPVAGDVHSSFPSAVLHVAVGRPVVAGVHKTRAVKEAAELTGGTASCGISDEHDVAAVQQVHCLGRS